MMATSWYHIGVLNQTNLSWLEMRCWHLYKCCHYLAQMHHDFLLLPQVQMQADVRAVMSGRQQQRQFSSIRSVASALLQQQGITGLWRGGLLAVQRAALVNLGELSTYDSVSVCVKG